MVGGQFTFVQALPLSRSKRDQELEQAKARSHAAKISHRRTKDERGSQQSIVTVAKKKHAETNDYLLRQHGGSPFLRKSNASYTSLQASDICCH